MENRPPATTTHEEACQRVASLFPQRRLRHYAASKLRSDPLFLEAYQTLRDATAPLLDLGCGVGLLAFYLRERGCHQTITGLDADGRKIRRAIGAGARYRGLEFIQHDVQNELPPFSGNVALFDLLHYLAPARQETLLLDLAARVPRGGVLLLRDGVRDGSARFWMTYAGEVFAQAISWNVKTPLHFPTAESVSAAFNEPEFIRECRPAWGATPFNNQLFIFRRV